MANITTENINTLAQLAASISDGDYIYIYKAASHSFARIEKSVFLQAIGGASSSQTITNVDIIQERFDALIDALANYAFIDGKSDSMKIGELDWESQGGGDEPTPTPTPAITSPTNNSTVSIGTNTGSGVSKTIAIKGSNLTKQLTVSVSGTDFRVEPSFITPTSANNGTHITVTYNGTEASATGSVVISSSEVSVTVNLTASYEEEVVATPKLSSPADVSINLGTIAANDSSVSVQKTVQGSNLTDVDLTVAVTGEGFSVAPTTITKTEAETGQTITITYTNSETQSSLLTARGSLQISGGGITTKTISLTASKQAEGVTPTLYQVTNQLTNATSSNTNTSVAAGESFYAKLTPTERLHVINDDSVIVTMGGVDVTEDVYENDEISIDNVTGDLVITASTITYVSSDLVMHLDESAADINEGEWSSEVGNYVFALTDVTKITGEKGVVFNGETSKAVCEQQLNVLSSAGTIEFVVAQHAITTGRPILLNGTVQYGISAIEYVSSSVICVSRETAYRQNEATESPALVATKYPDKQNTIQEQYSLSNDLVYINGVPATDIGTNENARFVYRDAQRGLMTIGYRLSGAAGTEMFYSLTVKSIRVYSDHLTATEIAQNYKVDKKMFNL